MKRMFSIYSKYFTIITGGVIVVCIILAALGASLISEYDPYKIDLNHRLESPSTEHYFGTDDFGRDIFSRSVYGARISLEVGIVSRVIALMIGAILGMVAGYFSGKIDYVIMRMTDVMFAFPVILFLIAITAAFGPSLKILFIGIGFVGWAPLARLMRAQVLTLKDQEFIVSTKALGLSHYRILVYHILPNSLAPLIVSFSMGMAAAIMAEASLSFIGLGAQPPMPSWGAMISTGREYLRIAPWMTFFPGFCIAITVLGFNLLGDGLRDKLDPKMKF